MFCSLHNALDLLLFQGIVGEEDSEAATKHGGERLPKILQSGLLFLRELQEEKHKIFCFKVFGLIQAQHLLLFRDQHLPQAFQMFYFCEVIIGRHVLNVEELFTIQLLHFKLCSKHEGGQCSTWLQGKGGESAVLRFLREKKPYFFMKEVSILILIIKAFWSSF